MVVFNGISFHFFSGRRMPWCFKSGSAKEDNTKHLGGRVQSLSYQPRSQGLFPILSVVEVVVLFHFKNVGKIAAHTIRFTTSNTDTLSKKIKHLLKLFPLKFAGEE